MEAKSFELGEDGKIKIGFKAWMGPLSRFEPSSASDPINFCIGIDMQITKAMITKRSHGFLHDLTFKRVR